MRQLIFAVVRTATSRVRSYMLHLPFAICLLAPGQKGTNFTGLEGATRVENLVSGTLTRRTGGEIVIEGVLRTYANGTSGATPSIANWAVLSNFRVVCHPLRGEGLPLQLISQHIS